MKQIELARITMRNFKGIRDLTVLFNGHTRIWGDNATGKTTIQDAFMWALFGKDSSNKADFDIKTLNSSGEAEHNLEHSVLVDLRVNGTPMTLKKVYSEKWTKKRGSASPEFTGHTIDHWIDGVPMKEKEYQERIGQVILEGIFRLITDPRYFNEVLKDADRRKILFGVCGNISREAVIASDPRLAGLNEVLGGYSIEDYKKVAQAERVEINREMTKIPTRIDECNRSIVETSPNISGIPKEIALLEAKKTGLEARLAGLRNGGAITERRIALQNVKADIQEQKNLFDVKRSERIAPLLDEVHALEEAQRATKKKIRDLDSEKYDIEVSIKAHEKSVEILKAEWYEVDAQEITVKDSCPTCGQALPEIQVNQAREKAMNIKAARLAGISLKGKECSAIVAQRKARLEEIIAEIKGISLDESVTARIAEINEQIVKIRAEEPVLTDLIALAESIQGEIDNISASSQSTIQGVEAELSATNAEIRTLNAELAKADSNKAAAKRIQDLTVEQQALAKRFEELEANLFMIETYIRAEAALQEGTINMKFNLARFRLFEDQINGGLRDVCETTLNGVPYSSINNAGKIQVGMDIIKTLQAHYQVSGPVWIDNAESIVQLPEMDCQTISLIVSEPDKKLRVA